VVAEEALEHKNLASRELAARRCEPFVPPVAAAEADAAADHEEDVHGLILIAREVLVSTRAALCAYAPEPLPFGALAAPARAAV